MKRLLALVLLVTGCASAGGGPKRTCPVVEVQNNGYWDVRVYTTDPLIRLGFVPGLTTVALRACNLRGLPADFTVRAMGDHFVLTLQGNSQYVSDGDRIGLSIGAAPNQSFIIGG